MFEKNVVTRGHRTFCKIYQTSPNVPHYRDVAEKRRLKPSVTRRTVVNPLTHSKNLVYFLNLYRLKDNLTLIKMK